MNPECRYVAQNSGQTQYSFTVSLDSCGTQFINDFEGEAGQAYLENVLVLQVNRDNPICWPSFGCIAVGTGKFRKRII